MKRPFLHARWWEPGSRSNGRELGTHPSPEGQDLPSHRSSGIAGRTLWQDQNCVNQRFCRICKAPGGPRKQRVSGSLTRHGRRPFRLVSNPAPTAAQLLTSTAVSSYATSSIQPTVPAEGMGPGSSNCGFQTADSEPRSLAHCFGSYPLSRGDPTCRHEPDPPVEQADRFGESLIPGVVPRLGAGVPEGRSPLVSVVDGLAVVLVFPVVSLAGPEVICRGGSPPSGDCLGDGLD
jgi:hypothetical protein